MATTDAGAEVEGPHVDDLNRSLEQVANGAGSGAVPATPPDEKQVPDIVKAACRFAAARGRPAAVFLLGEGNAELGTPDTPITRRTVIQLAAALDDHFKFQKLDLVIQSSGGDIHAAYQMMSLLRNAVKKEGELVACVPRKAQSSATLLCLGCDQIMLDELGTLGPLDAQIRVGLTEVGTPDYSSALHLLKGLDRLQEFSLDTLSRAAAMLYDNQMRRNDDILKYGIEFSRGITAPLFERIESHKIGYWEQMLKTGEEYGRRLLHRGKLLKQIPKAERAGHIDRVIRTLVNDYPSHEFVLDVPELQSLKLDAMPFDDHVRSAARQFSRRCSDTLIMVVYPPGCPRPDGMSDALGKPTADWSQLGADNPGEDVSWTDTKSKETEPFVMRVGLYRPPLKSVNPWRDRARTNDHPATQFLAGGGGAPPW